MHSAPVCRLVRMLLCAALAVGSCGVACAAGQRAGHLLELASAYGDSHFDPQSGLIADVVGVPDVSTDSPGYAVALLERGENVERARSIVRAILGHQDREGKSETRGAFKWGVDDEGFDIETVVRVAPFLARAYGAHADKLGEDLAGEVKEALELAIECLSPEDERSEDEEALIRYGALALMGAALGRPQYTAQAVGLVTGWGQRISTHGRHWPPSPRLDALRLLALQQIWQVATPAQRLPVEEALVLCYRDFAQRVHLAAGTVAGSAAVAAEDCYSGQGISSYLIYRDFGPPLTVSVRPFAVAFVLCDYVPPASVTALVRPDFKPYSVETNSGEAHVTRIPARTDTYMAPGFTLGTMTGWCTPDSVPVYATFGREQARPTLYFTVHDAPAHVSNLQANNLAVCSFNFDRMGAGNRVQAWVEGMLGGARDVQEVYALGAVWNGQPMAISSQGTVIVRRGGTYVAVTLLESGPAGVATTTRRKPGVLEWKAVGEDAQLTLSVYARQEDFRVADPLDDVRAGFVIQIWDESEFESLEAAVAWLEGASVRQSYAPLVEREVLPGQEPHVLDKDKPRPKDRYKIRTQKVHTVTYGYRRGRGKTFTLVEDLGGEVVLSRMVDDTEIGTPFWWDSPALTLPPGQEVIPVQAP